MVHTDQPDDDVVAAPGKADADSQEDPAASLARWKEYIYREELPDEELEPARKVLVEYSGVAPGDVETHIRRIVCPLP